MFYAICLESQPSQKLVICFSTLATMGRKGQAAKERKRTEKYVSERDKQWIEVNYKEWDDARAGSKRPASKEPVSSASCWHELQSKVISEVRAKKERAQGTGASGSGQQQLVAAGVVHPAAEGEEPDRCLDLEEGIEVWKELCNTVFPKLASFEPMQYVSIVAGRPVVVPRVANESLPLAPKSI